MKTFMLNKLIIIGMLFSLIGSNIIVIGINPATKSEINIIEEYFMQFDCDKNFKHQIKYILNANKSSKYYIFSVGFIANSYFIKIPRLLTQRGIIFAAQIRYKLPPALTIVFEKNNSTGIKLITIERGNHRVIFFGIGHSGFTRPHIFSFGRVIAASYIKPIVI